MPTYTDTGLGWYAYVDWVKNSVDLLATLQSDGGVFPSGITVVSPGNKVLVSDGDTLCTCSGSSQYVGRSPWTYGINPNPDIPVYCVCLRLFENWNGPWIISASRDNVLQYYANGHQSTDAIYEVNVYGITYYLNSSQHEKGGNPSITSSFPVIQSTLSRSETVSAIVEYCVNQSISFYKFLPGYCVACIAEWGVRGEPGSYIGPILASTNSQYVALSTDNQEAYSGHVWYEDLPAPGERVYFQAIRDFSLPDYQHVIEDLTVPYVNLGIGEISDTQIAFQILEKSGWHWGTYEDADPYADGGESEAGGGDGTFDFSSTEIPYGGLPTIGAFATGMVDVYMPTRAELVALSQYLWAGAFDVDNFKKIVADPMDVIIGLHIVPLTKAQVGVTSSTLVVGNISTGISMDKASKQYVLFDMGSIEILPKWGAYLDFSPYSKLTLFLPYIGYVDISPDDCMDGTIGVQYYIDIISGICVAQVKCNDHVLYQFSGNCSCQLPITAGQYQNIAIAGMNILGSVLGSASSMMMPKGGGDTGDKLGAASGAVNLLGTIASEGLSMFKPSVQRSGGFGSSSGLMGIQTPYLILTVPRMCIPGEQNKYIGYPSFVTKVMSTLSGFNSVQVTHLNNMSCTAEEADEIIALLSQGVIF